MAAQKARPQTPECGSSSLKVKANLVGGFSLKMGRKEAIRGLREDRACAQGKPGESTARGVCVCVLLLMAADPPAHLRNDSRAEGL